MSHRATKEDTVIVHKDVVIIGGGLIGTGLARELSRYKLSVTLLERNADVAGISTRSNHGLIYRGLMLVISHVVKSYVFSEMPMEAEVHKEREKIRAEGFNLFEQVAGELDIPYRWTRTLILARNDDEIEFLRRAERACTTYGIRVRWVDENNIRAMEPNISKDFIAGICSDDSVMVIFGPDFSIAYAENAVANGINIMTEAEVTGISQDGDYQIVETTKGRVKTKFVVNAAGGDADKIMDMVTDERDWERYFNSTNTLILDKRLKDLVHGIVMSTPGPGINDFVVPQIHGNPYLSFSSYSGGGVKDRYNTATTAEGINDNFTRAQRMLPSISRSDVIASFLGVRAYILPHDDYILGPVKKNPRFINAVITPPGLCAAPAVITRLVDILHDQGLPLEEKRDFNPVRKRIPRFNELPDEEKEKLIAKDPRYGHVVCRCETVTEGEITEAIKRGGRTVDAIKYRVRAGMGRCQAGYCGPQVVRILARELNIPISQVTKSGGNSEIVPYRSKEFLLTEVAASMYGDKSSGGRR
jgi:glycerol-3-phosphate dehydrogenase